MGWRASDTRELSFADAAVPEDHLLGNGARLPAVPRHPGRGAHLRRGLLGGPRDGRVRRGAQVCQRPFRHSGRPITKFQAIQFKFADMLTEIEHAKLMVLKAAWEKDKAGISPCREPRKALLGRTLESRRQSSRANSRGLRLHGRVPGVADVPRSKDQRDRRRTNEVQRVVIAPDDRTMKRLVFTAALVAATVLPALPALKTGRRRPCSAPRRPWAATSSRTTWR